ncbi:MAG: M1 family metallopeptidase [Anditalea sp.]
MTLNKYFGFLLLLYVLISCNPTRVVPDHSQEEQQDEVKIIKEEIREDSPNIKKEELAQERERGILQYEGSRERKFDLLHTSLDLQFDYDKQSVMGKALLTLKPYFYDQDILELDAKDFEIHEVWLAEGNEVRPLALRYDQRKATVILPKAYTAKDTLEVGMSYTAKPNENSGLGSEAIKDNKGLYFINPEKDEGKPVQIWTQGETEHNSKWFPTIDSPNERATHDIKLTVEDKYTTISNGRLLSQTFNGDGSRTDHWEMDLPHAPYLTAIVIGEFAQISDSLGKLPLNYFVEKEYEMGAKKVFENTPEMIVFFSRLLGVDFPWQKYDQIVVRDFVSGAMENTTASIFMEALNLDEREALDSEWDYIIAHELFHQWFGNYVTLESWSNLPLNEAFADYSEYLWMEHKDGKDAADMHHIVGMEGYFSEAEEKQVDLIRFDYEHMEDMFDSHSYAKGGRVLHMLRRYVGDEAFFASLNYYLEQHAFSSVEIHDLRLAFEKVTGRDLNWFFNQWFLASGHPVLDIRLDKSQPDNILLTIKQKQDLENTPLYKLPFTVAWYEDGQRTQRNFTLDQASQQFALENGGSPDLVVVDESMVLLAVKDTYRGRGHFEKQVALAEAGIARYEALDSLANNYTFDKGMGQTFFSALKDEFPSVRELALAKIQSNLDSMFLPEDAEEMILTIAESDPENPVRAGAIELLNEVGRDKYAPLFQSLVNDSSYYVAGAALSAYLDNENHPQRENMANRLTGTENIRMIAPLADYFTSLPDPTKADWFHSKLEKLTGESLYYFIGYYADYFARQEELDHGVTLNNLNEIAESNPANYIRLAAFQALFGFIDEKGVLEKVKVLHAGEKDERVKEYQGFFLEGYVEED